MLYNQNSEIVLIGIDLSLLLLCVKYLSKIIPVTPNYLVVSCFPLCHHSHLMCAILYLSWYCKLISLLVPGLVKSVCQCISGTVCLYNTFSPEHNIFTTTEHIAVKPGINYIHCALRMVPDHFCDKIASKSISSS